LGKGRLPILRHQVVTHSKGGKNFLERGGGTWGEKRICLDLLTKHTKRKNLRPETKQKASRGRRVSVRRISSVHSRFAVSFLRQELKRAPIKEKKGHVSRKKGEGSQRTRGKVVLLSGKKKGRICNRTKERLRASSQRKRRRAAALKWGTVVERGEH